MSGSFFNTRERKKTVQDPSRNHNSSMRADPHFPSGLVPKSKSHRRLCLQEADDLVAVAARLPDVEVRWKQPTPSIPAQQQPEQAGEEAAVEAAMSISVTLQRHSSSRASASTRVYAPRFPKVCI